MHVDAFLNILKNTYEYLSLNAPMKQKKMPFIHISLKGAFWALMLAFLTGVIRMILVFVYHDSGGCGEEDPRPAVLKNFHYMYFSLFITLLTAAAALIISFLTEKPKEKHVSERISSQKEYGQTHRYIGFFTGTKRNQEVHFFTQKPREITYVQSFLYNETKWRVH